MRKEKDYKIEIIIAIVILVILIGVLIKVIIDRENAVEEVNVPVSDSTQNVNENASNNIEENTEQENNKEQNIVETDEGVPIQNPQSIYENDSDVGSTNKKQEAINLVKQKWGEDNTVKFTCDSVTSDGKYIIAVVSISKATVENYFIVDLENKTVKIDY